MNKQKTQIAGVTNQEIIDNLVEHVKTHYPITAEFILSSALKKLCKIDNGITCILDNTTKRTNYPHYKLTSSLYHY